MLPCEIEFVEFPIYGLGREGLVRANIIDLDAAPPTTKYTRELGQKYYELSDHLGNPRVIITDRLLSDVVNGTPGKYRSDIVGYSNQYPYGMEQPGRYMNGSGYRYGYNGMERDSAVTGGHHTTYFRQYDARLGRFWSTDPITHSWESPYVAMGGNPIALADPSGAEPGNPDEQGRGATQGGPEDDGPEDPPVGPLREGTVYTDQNDATWVWQRNTAGEHEWVRGVMVTALRELPIPNMVQPNLMQGWLASNKWKLEAGDPMNTRSYQVEHARQEQRRMVMNVASYYPMMGVQGTGLATSYLAGLAYDGAYGLRDDLYVLATDRAHQAGLSETPALHLNGQMATGQDRLDAHMSAYITAFTLFTPSGVARAGRGVTAAGEGSAVAPVAAESEVTVYRVFGGDARAQGFSWTTKDPRTVSNFRDVAGLPSGGASGATNTADFLIKGKVNAADIIKSRLALPLDGNKGGLPELIIDPKNVKITDFSVLKP